MQFTLLFTWFRQQLTSGMHFPECVLLDFPYIGLQPCPHGCTAAFRAARLTWAAWLDCCWFISLRVLNTIPELKMHERWVEINTALKEGCWYTIGGAFSYCIAAVHFGSTRKYTVARDICKTSSAAKCSLLPMSESLRFRRYWTRRVIMFSYRGGKQFCGR